MICEQIIAEVYEARARLSPLTILKPLSLEAVTEFGCVSSVVGVTHCHDVIVEGKWKP